ncbi:hypothetical protein C900_02080 [Fulvivirga imtechensis AK7]|uniref:Uncharacterized protein n=1 Tax=Fulvivirga imtechensis AK7 TaxID=1237149 RepID=L8JX76_9BACT|nr:ATP-binding protein [Fulvivirga imtechensis]ELR73676.1 hypothetical protein C900_02080 [Fulvivirga imtechensis AK7]
MSDYPISDIVVAITAGSLLFFLLCAFIVAFTLVFVRKRQQHKIEKQQIKDLFSKNLLEAQLEIREQTLKHIGYELHDNIGQIASLIKINLNIIDLGAREKAEEKLDETRSLLRKLISDIKGLSVSLNSDRIVSTGLCEGLKNELDQIKKLGLYQVEFHCVNKNIKLDPSKAIILFRMSQEILNNILKHSNANHISVNAEVYAGFLKLTFKDNGVGFDIDEVIKRGGSGLLNLRTRAKVIHADLKISSTTHAGTEILINMPLTNEFNN